MTRSIGRWVGVLAVTMGALFCAVSPSRGGEKLLDFLDDENAAPADEIEREVLGPSEAEIEELATLTRIGDTVHRAQAIWRLARVNDELCVAPLIGLIPDAPPDLRPYVAMGVGWLGSKARNAAPSLARYLDDGSDFTASATLWALGRLGDPAVKLKIEPFTKSDDELIRFLAEEALFRLAGKRSPPRRVAGP